MLMGNKHNSNTYPHPITASGQPLKINPIPPQSFGYIMGLSWIPPPLLILVLPEGSFLLFKFSMRTRWLVYL